MTKDNAINFLLYNMLGVTTKDDDGDKVKAAIIRAYDDATMLGAYNTLFKGDPEWKKDVKEKSEEAKKEAGTLILSKIERFFDSSCKNDNYDGWHNDLVKS